MNGIVEMYIIMLCVLLMVLVIIVGRRVCVAIYDSWFVMSVRDWFGDRVEEIKYLYDVIRGRAY